MAANYDEVEDIVLAYNDTGVQGQRYADGGVTPLPNIVIFARKLVIKSAMLQECWQTVFDLGLTQEDASQAEFRMLKSNLK